MRWPLVAPCLWFTYPASMAFLLTVKRGHDVFKPYMKSAELGVFINPFN
jgi:hypothetical protein